MSGSANVYELLEAELRASFACCHKFGELVAARPTNVDEVEFDKRRRRHRTFQNFFESVKSIFARCVAGRQSSELRRMVLQDSWSFVPSDLYERLPEAAWSTPLFFRTDESRNGDVFEIQCPGSGWGDLPLLRTLYRAICPSSWMDAYTPEATIAADIADAVGASAPQVLHLLDNASNPASMRSLISKTQPPLRYCGYEPDTKNGEAQFVRSHSVFGLISENLFRTRLELCARDLLKFDLPPLVIFDQKMMMCLPFLDETADEFNDTIRDALVYSHPVTERGFRDVDGAWVTIPEFLDRPNSKRRYFLKYGGSDTNRNWGSRAVYRLDSKKNATSLLSAAVDDAQRGLPWIIQPEASEKETVSYFDRKSGELVEANLTTRYSSFYGPSGLVGLRSMHRKHHKVHGQPDTVVGLAAPIARNGA